MPRIDFYLIPDTEIAMQWRFACKLAEKAFQQNQAFYIYLENKTQESEFDDLLWIYKDTSFIPHALSDSALAADAPIIIGSEPPAINYKYNILLNLNNNINIPEFFNNFNRIIEIIPEINTIKIDARKRYEIYKKKGYALNTIEMKKQI